MLMVLLLGWLFVPIYIASGVRGLHTQQTHTWMFTHCLTILLYSSYVLYSSLGDHHARIFAKAIWWEENTIIYSGLVLIYLHLH